jgi:hypothetical protein
MARRSKTQSTAFGALIIVALIIGGIAKLFDEIGVAIPLLVVAAAIGLFIWHKLNQQAKRLQFLRAKYGDEEIVQRILKHKFWRGQTADQLVDSLGNPVNVDRRLLKSKAREVWKYNLRGVNRYGLRITLDENIVNGWDQKS